MASQSTRYYCCHFATSGALKTSHHRINVASARSVSHFVTFFGIKKNIVVHACCRHFPLCSTFSRNCTISPLVSFVSPRGPQGGSRHNLLLSLRYTSSKRHSFGLGSASSALLNSSFFQCFSSTFCTTSSHCQCFCPFFPFFAAQRSSNLASFFFICQDLHSSPPCCAL